MPRKPALPADEQDIVVGDALDSLLALTRDQAAAIAVQRCRVPWVAKAARAKTLEVVCLGRFDLANPERPDLPWPSVVFLLSRPKLGVHPAVCCSVALYWSPDGDWETSDREPVETPTGDRRLLIDWSQFAGDPDGPPGLVNGDGVVPEAGPAALWSAPSEAVSRGRPPAAPSAPMRAPIARTSEPGPSAGLRSEPRPSSSDELRLLKLRVVDRLLRWLEE